MTLYRQMQPFPLRRDMQEAICSGRYKHCDIHKKLDQIRHNNLLMYANNQYIKDPDKLPARAKMMQAL